MKSLKLALFLGTSLGLANLVVAESFNDKSTEMTTYTYPSDSRLSATAAAAPENFKEQSEWATIVPNRSPSQCAASHSKGTNLPASGFSDISSNAC